ncbi:MAG: hypothetical protein ACRDHL_12135, partial [Candidatus Promineifilaceae bacterium]
MRSSFDWQTSDEAGAATRPPAETAGRRPAWRRIIPVFLLLLLAATAAILLARQRLAAAEAAVEQEVLASYGLVQQAAAQADVDLLTPFISGRDPDWSAGYRSLAQRGHLFDYPALGLRLVKPAGAEPQISLAPDLLSAEVTGRFTYEVAAPDGLTDTVALERTDVYRRGSDRWLFAPPEQAFWGGRRSARSQRLSVSYPGRDAEIVEGLIVYLDLKVGEACQMLGNCPAGFRFELSLDTGPDSLLAPADRAHPLDTEPPLSLPASSLVGLPVDAAGRQALYRGYAAEVLAALITGRLGYECCQNSIFYRALLDRVLAELGLRAWPLDALAYERLLNELPLALDLGAFNRRASVSPWFDVRWQHIYALVEYLETLPPHDTRQERLRDFLAAANISTWIGRYVTGSLYAAGTARDWFEFVYAGSLSATRDGVELPAGPILATCFDPGQNGRAFPLQFDLPGGESRLIPFADHGAVARLGASRSLLLLQAGGGLGPEGWYVGRDGRWRLVFDNEPAEGGPQYVPTSNFATAEHLTVFRPREPAGPVEDPPLLFDLAVSNCAWPACPLTPLPGLPVWAPGGAAFVAQVLSGWESYSRPSDLLLAVLSGARLQLGRGYSPFWLDKRSYGFVNPAGEVMLAEIGREPQRLLGIEELVQTAGGQAPAADLVIPFVVAGPPGRDLLLIGLRPTAEAGPPHLLAYSPADGRLSPIAGPPFTGPFSFSFAPGGRWLAFDSPSSGEQVPLLVVLDLDALKVSYTFASPYSIAAADWSADGRWLLRATPAFLEIIAPGFEVAPGLPYRRLIFTAPLRCENAFWADGELALA